MGGMVSNLVLDRVQCKASAGQYSTGADVVYRSYCYDETVPKRRGIVTAG